MTRMVATLNCLLLPVVLAALASAQYQITQVRLVGGKSNLEGRVEVQMGQAWGTVCDDGWDHRDARVICTMLSSTGGVALTGAYFGQGTVPILLDDVDCQGYEADINLCRLGLQQPSRPTCQHSEDAGVKCGVSPSSFPPASPAPSPIPLPAHCSAGTPTVPRVRLLGLNKHGESGLVQVDASGSGNWGYVCDDGWDQKAAMVVCRELCYSTASDAQPGWRGTLTAASGTIKLDDVVCVGTESSLLSCTHSTTNDCNLNELAAVTCKPEDHQQNSVPDPDLTCFEEEMLVEFNKTRNPMVAASQIQLPTTVSKPACTIAPTDNATYISLTMKYADCADESFLSNAAIPVHTITYLSLDLGDRADDQMTGRGEITALHLGQNETYFTYNVTLELGNAQKSAGAAQGSVQVNFDFSVELICNLLRVYNRSRELEDMRKQVLLETEKGEYDVVMNFYGDDTFRTVISKGSVLVNPGAWTNVGLLLETTATDLKMVVNDCKAVADPTQNNSPSRDLIVSKCPVNDTDIGVGVYPISALLWGFRFKPFVFVGYPDMTIECATIVCKQSEVSETCDRSCKNQKPVGRRKRFVWQREPDAFTVQMTYTSRPYISLEDTVTDVTGSEAVADG